MATYDPATRGADFRRRLDGILRHYEAVPPLQQTPERLAKVDTVMADGVESVEMFLTLFDKHDLDQPDGRRAAYGAVCMAVELAGDINRQGLLVLLAAAVGLIHDARHEYTGPS